MNRRSSAPSARLLRAVAAELGDLERRRDGLLERRRRVQAELDEIEASVAELDERLMLIGRLGGDDPPQERPTADEPSVARPSNDAGQGRSALRGPAIRAAAVRVLLAHPRRPEAIHYREWFELLNEAGHSVAGKDPLAVFLTQLSRSPLVRRGTQSGVYELDLHAPARLRRRLQDLQAELRELTTTASSATTDLSSIRNRRMALNLEIGKVERALEETEETLTKGPEAPGLAAAG
jgi:chaperonin cofactor prefoldin